MIPEAREVHLSSKDRKVLETRCVARHRGVQRPCRFNIGRAVRGARIEATNSAFPACSSRAEIFQDSRASVIRTRERIARMVVFSPLRDALSCRIAQLDQRTALPDQCLHLAEADVRPPRRKSGFAE